MCVACDTRLGDELCAPDRTLHIDSKVLAKAEAETDASAAEATAASEDESGEDVDADEVTLRVEAIVNAAKHAQAKNVSVVVESKPHSVIAIIEDDGRGFDEAQVDDAERFGLQGMHERAEMIGAQLSVESKVGHGTLVQLTMNHDQWQLKND